jgi:hypothetical protein
LLWKAGQGIQKPLVRVVLFLHLQKNLSGYCSGRWDPSFLPFFKVTPSIFQRYSLPVRFFAFKEGGFFTKEETILKLLRSAIFHFSGFKEVMFSLQQSSILDCFTKQKINP